MSTGRGLLYLDSSALVKLVIPEAETDALVEALTAWPDKVSSELAYVEVHRAALRAADATDVRERAEDVLTALNLLRLDMPVLRQAASLSPAGLRSLDAIHLASALSIGPDISGMAVYDKALTEAAQAQGWQIVAPS